MRSRRFTVRFPNPVQDGAVRRQIEQGFESESEYLTNLVRCDLILQRGHEFTLWLAAQSDEDQDFIDDCLQDFKPSVPGSQPSLTHHFCRAIIDLQIARHGCTSSVALEKLPSSVRELCLKLGFS